MRNVKRGCSGTIDSTGRLTSELVPLELEAPELLGPIPIDRRGSLYVKWGNWIPLVLVAFVLAVIAMRGAGSVRRLRGRTPRLRGMMRFTTAQKFTASL